jgi:N-hydroxyarylamine O-acetyltransferase
MTMSTLLDIDAYFERIRWGAPTTPTYQTLADLLDGHMASIPFENLDVLLGRPIRVDLEGVQAKLVSARRGGYCFEQATLFGAVLERLGFQVTRHTARVTMLLPRSEAARTHMFLAVAIANEIFVVDPGFGSLASRVPVPLIDGASEGADHPTHWMVRDGALWVLKTQVGDKPIDAWVSTMERENDVDFVMGSHFTSTYPASPFVNRLMMRALTPDGRITVMNRDMTVCRDNVPHLSQLADRSALRALLATHFGFDLPEVEHLRIPTVPEWD